MRVSSGLLLLDLIHNSIYGEAEAGHAWQVTDRNVKFQCAFFPSVVRTSTALAAHCWLAQQLSAVEEPGPHLDLGGEQGFVFIVEVKLDIYLFTRLFSQSVYLYFINVVSLLLM